MLRLYNIVKVVGPKLHSYVAENTQLPTRGNDLIQLYTRMMWPFFNYISYMVVDIVILVAVLKFKVQVVKLCVYIANPWFLMLGHIYQHYRLACMSSQALCMCRRSVKSAFAWWSFLCITCKISLMVTVQLII